MVAASSGLELSRYFYQDAVTPVLQKFHGALPHSAALLGRGSEVLGYDDEMSRDHSWQPRVLLFLREEDHARHGEPLNEVLRQDLPSTFQGHPTRYEIHTLRGYIDQQLEVDIDGEIRARDWLTFSEQRLLMVTAGEVFHDDVGLQQARDRLSYYPHDVWLYLLAAGWWRIHPETNVVGRAGDVGDELGSAIIGSRLVSDLMRLCFLLERQYAPYAKWFGSAFEQLTCAAELSPFLWRVLRADSWQERESALMSAYEVVAGLHNDLAVTEPVPTQVHQLWGRPFTVVWGDFPTALHQQITDPEVQRIAERWPAGGVDHFRDLLLAPGSRTLLLRMFDEL